MTNILFIKHGTDPDSQVLSLICMNTGRCWFQANNSSLQEKRQSITKRVYSKVGRKIIKKKIFVSIKFKIRDISALSTLLMYDFCLNCVMQIQ